MYRIMKKKKKNLLNLYFIRNYLQMFYAEICKSFFFFFILFQVIIFKQLVLYARHALNIKTKQQQKIL